ncbi:MAG: hypothetical protein DMG42_17300 [Acidobacteria bacterium]|nr:MAG: hypothetical protein DMG42_17300 [Acidobacteriota bacterium]
MGATQRSHLGKTNREAVGILAACGGEDVNAVILESQGMKQPSELTPGNSEQCDKHQVVRFFGGLLL